MKGIEKMSNHPIFILVLVGCLCGVAIAPISLSDGLSADDGSTPTLSPNQVAAGGPLPGNLSLRESEQDCIKSLQNESTWAPWYPIMANTEHGGSERAAVFECAHFGGSFTEPNQVYAYRSPDSLRGVPSWIDTRDPNELLVSGGGASLALPGPFISKMEAGSL